MSLELIVKSLYSIVWELSLIFILMCIGGYFSFKLKFLQIRYLKEAFKYLINPKNVNSTNSILRDISSFGFLFTALSATLWTGNIVGIVVVITVGGPGTLFWIVVLF